MRCFGIMVWLVACGMAVGLAVKPLPGYLRSDLPVPDGTYGAWAMAISEHGIIGGGAAIPYGDYGGAIAIVWPNARKITDLEFGPDSVCHGVGKNAYLINASPWRCFVLTGKTVTELPTLGGDFIEGTCINNLGQVAGWSKTADGKMHAFFWDGARMYDIGDLGGGQSYAWDLNDDGVVVGVSYTVVTNDYAEAHGFRWTKKGGLVDVTPGTGTNSAVYGINRKGQMTGFIFDGPDRHGVVWETDGTITELPELGFGCYPSKINNRGMVCGIVIDDQHRCRACVWTAGSLILLDHDSIIDSRAVDLDDRGQVVGSYQVTIDDTIGCVWRPR